MNPTELRAKRANIVVNLRALLSKAEAEKRELAADEQQQYDRGWAESEQLKADIAKAEGDLQRRANLAAAEEELSRPVARHVALDRPGLVSGARGHDGAAALKPYSFKYKAGAKLSRRGKYQRVLKDATLQPGTAAWDRHQPQYRDALRAWWKTGQPQAALQTDVDTAGGYMTVPEEFVAEYLMNVDDQRWIRRLARTFQTTAQTLGAVKRTAKAATFAWGSELTSPTADTTLAFGKRSLTPHYMTGLIQVSNDLLRSAVLDIDSIIMYEIERDSGELEENAFLTGTGGQQPLGLFTATADGIDTSRDVSTGNTTTAIGADNLREMKYSLKLQYRNNPACGWLWSRTAVKQISKLKDGMGQYLWQDGITVGDPDRILGYPVYESEFCPSTFTSQLYVGLLGCFQYYWIADSLTMDMQRLVELYAATNQTGFICRRKVDGMPQIAEAFVRSKLA